VGTSVRAGTFSSSGKDVGDSAPPKFGSNAFSRGMTENSLKLSQATTVTKL